MSAMIDIPTNLKLWHLTGLRHLNLGDPTYPAAVGILSRPLPPDLMTVGFNMTFDETGEVRGGRYQSLDKHLCTTPFHSLKQVRIFYYGGLSLEKASTTI